MNFEPICSNSKKTRRTSINLVSDEQDITDNSVSNYEPSNNVQYTNESECNIDVTGMSEKSVVEKKPVHSKIRKNSSILSSRIILYHNKTDYKGKKLFNISLILLGLVGFLFLLLYIIIAIRGGWAQSEINDFSTRNKSAILLLSIFTIFISFIGLCGSYTTWKPIVLTVTLFTCMAFLGHLYVAKKMLDTSRFASRDMAFAWWDNYSDEVIVKFQEQYNCCGYKNYIDKGRVSANCPVELVTYVLPADIQEPAKVEKNDSYKQKYGAPSATPAVPNTNIPDYDPTVTPPTTDTTTNPVTDTTTTTPQDTWNPTTDTTTTDPNVDTPVADTPVTDTPAADTTDTTTGNGDTNWDNTTPTTDNIDQTEAVYKKRSRIHYNKSSPEAKERLENVVIKDIKNDSKTNKITINLDLKKSNNNTVNDNTKKPQKLKARQDDTTTTPITTTINTEDYVGCESQIVDKVKSKATPLYIIGYMTVVIHIIVVVSSIQFWLDLRTEKEYDEFS